MGFLLLLWTAQTPASTARFIYDDLGRLHQVIDETGNVATYTYDAVGNLLSITRSTGGVGAPQITAVTPTTADAGSTAMLTLTGANLSGAALTTDNPGISVSQVETAATSLTATLTIAFSARTGATTLTVSHAAGSASTTLNISAAAPVISTLTPSSGPVSRLVMLSGNGFSSTPGLNSVSFNGTAATVLSATPTRLLTAVPAGAASGPVTVTVGGLTSAGVPFTVTTAAGPAPTISTVSPAVGSVDGGGAVTITGSGFTSDTRLLIGGNVGSRLTISSDTTLTAFTPPGRVGPADILVTNANGDAFIPGGFTYLTGSSQKIVSVNPTMGVATIPQNTTVGVLFSRPVDRATITSTSYSLVQTSTNTAVSGTFLYDLADTRVTFQPSSALAAGTTYTLSLTQAIKSAEGIPLEAPFIGAFTTTTGSDTISPTVTVSPANGATGVPYNSAIVFTFSEPIDPTSLTTARLTVTNQGASRNGTLTVSQQGQVATFMPASPFFPNTTVGLVLSGSVTDASGNRLIGSSGVGTDFVGSFTTATTADRVPPLILGITPPNGSTGINTNAAITITLNESLDPATVTAARITVVSGGVSRPGRLLLTSFNSVVTYLPDQPYPAFSDVTITISPGLTDVSGNSIVTAASATFTTQSSLDNFQPSVTSVSPSGSDVALNSRITLVFSERINPLTVTSSTFSVRRYGSVPLGGTIAVAPDQRSATFTPAQPLLPNETYYLTYTTGITDLAGNPLFNPTGTPYYYYSSATFRTGTRFADQTGPTVLELSPANGARDVPTNGQLLLRFSEPLAAPTVTPQTIVVASGGVPVETEVDLEQNSTVVRIRVANLLTWAPNTFYDVTVTPGVRDMADNPLAAPVTSGFTTGGGTDTTAPALLSTSPANGELNVAPSGAITLAFNEPIASPAVTPSNIYVSGGGIAGPVAGTISFSVDRKTITFQPSGLLPAGQSFTMYLYPFEDLAGNRTVASSRYFTTALASGTDGAALPQSAVVGPNPVQLFANGQTTSQVVIGNITNAQGVMVPNGTKIAVTAFPVFDTGSAGGVIVEGVTSLADPRFKVLTTFGGRVTVTYQSVNRPDLPSGQSAAAVIQVASVDAAEQAVRLLGKASITLVRQTTASVTANPTVLRATGTSYAQVDVMVTGIDGRPVPEGSRIGVTTEPVYYPNSTAGSVSGGTPGVDPRFTILTTDRDGAFTLTVTPPALAASQSATTYLQVVQVDDTGNVVGLLGTGYLSLSGSSGALVPQPKITALSPSSGQMDVGTNAVAVARFSEPLDPATVTSTTVRLVGPNSAAVAGTLTLGAGPGGANSVVTFTPSGLLAPSTTYTFYVDGSIKSAAGTTLWAARSATFTTASGVDGTAPTVLFVNPGDGSSAVGTNATVMVRFSEGMNGATLHAGTVSLATGGTPVAATLAATFDAQSGQTLVTLRPHQLLGANTTYTLTLSAEITDAAGLALAGPVTATFSTGAAADTVQPEVVHVNPSGSNVPLNVKISLVFSEPINPATVTPSTFLVPGVSGTTTFSADRRTLVFTPDRPLAPSRGYSIYFRAGITDVAGNPLFNPTDPLPPYGYANPRLFVTGTEYEDASGPTVLSLSPLDGAVNVPTNAHILIRFSEPLAVYTATPQTITVTLGGVAVETDVSLEQNNTVARLKVANLQSWAPNTTYDITVTSGVHDIADNPVAVPVTSRFTTSGTVDTTGPTMTAFTPANGTMIAGTASLVATFNEPLAPASVSLNTFRVTGGGASHQTPGTLLVSADRTMVTFTPIAPFFSGQTYNVSVGGIEDLAGNRSSSPSSSFRIAVAAGTDTNALPTNATVLAPAPLLADGQSTTTVTITAISRNGVVVPNGTKVAVTAAPAYTASSAGGTILGGTTSLADPRFQIFTVQGGQVTVTYQSVSRPDLGTGPYDRATALIQVAAVDAADAPMHIIGSNTVTLFRGMTVTNASVNPTSLWANGTAYATARLTLLDLNGVPFPPGVLVGVTVDPVYDPGSAGGSLAGGVMAPDPRFKLVSTIRGGILEVTYTAPSFAAGQTGYAALQFVDVDDQGHIGRQLTSLSVALSGTSGFVSPLPTVTAVSPAHGQSGVALNSPIVVAFSQSLDPATVTASSFVLTKQSGAAIAGTRTLSAGEAGPNSVVTLTPSVPLDANASYYLYVNTAITSASGSPLLAAQTFSFSTGAATDTSVPIVMSVSPPDGTTGVPTNALVMIEFSEIMNAASLTAQTLTLTAGSSAVAARVTVTHDFARGRSVAVLTSDQLLAGNTTFTGSLTSASDTAGNQLAAPLAFSFTTQGGQDTGAPSVTAVSPPRASTGVPLNAKVSLVFSERINPVTVNGDTVRLNGPGGWVPVSLTTASDLRSVELTPTQPLVANTFYYVYYTNQIMDLAGNRLANPASGSAQSFTTGIASDTAPPIVLSINPANGATGVPINTQVVLQFSEPVTAARINSSTITVSAGGTPVESVLTVEEGTIVRFRLAGDVVLQADTVYTVSVRTTITDVAGNPLASPVTSTFVTGSVFDITKPTITSIVPANNATNIAPTDPIVITFSEPMDPTSVSPTDIRLSGTGMDGPVPGTITFSADNRTLTFSPSGRLFAGQVHFVQLPYGSPMTDQAGNTLDYATSSFTTALAAGTDPATLPTSAVVVATPGQLLADGQSTTTIMITGISRNGVLVPDGTKVAVTAAPAYRKSSAGGTILGGMTSPVDPRFQIFTVMGGQVTVTYQSVSRPDLIYSSYYPQTVSAFIQVAAVDAAEAPAGLIGVGTVSLFRGSRVTSATINPYSLWANGSSTAIATLTLVDANGTPFPPGVQLGATADPIYTNSAGGTLTGGTPSPDLRFKLFQTIRGGILEVEYTAPSLAAGQTGAGSIQFVEVDDQGNVVRFLTTVSLSLSGTSGNAGPLPTAIGISPLHGESNVALNSSIVVAFSQSLDPTTITASSVSLTSNSVAVPGTRVLSDGVAGPNSVVTFTPANPLMPNTSYTLVLNTAIKSASGGALLAYQTASFSTTTSTDSTAPTVVQTNPLAGATGVPTNVPIMIAFSERVSAATLNSATVILETGGNPVSGRIYVGTGMQNTTLATFLPDQYLPGNATFTLTVSGISDTAGNLMAAPFTFSFATQAASDNIQPTVTSFSPPTGSIDVPATTAITLTFSEPINPLTVHSGTVLIYNTYQIAGRSYGYYVKSAFEFSAGNTVVTVRPLAPLLSGTRPSVSVSTGVQDTAGNSLLNSSGSSFTVATAPGTADLPTGATVTINPQRFFSNGQIATTVTVSDINRNGTLVPNGTLVAVTADPVFDNSIGGVISGSNAGASADPRFLLFSTFGAAVTFSYTPPDLTHLPPNQAGYGSIYVTAVDLDNRPLTPIGFNTATLSGIQAASLVGSPTSLVADGTSTSTITVTVTDQQGNLVPDGTRIGLTAANIFVYTSAGGDLLGGTTSSGDSRLSIYTTTAGKVTATYRSPSAPGTGSATIQAVTIDGSGRPTGRAGSLVIYLQ